MHDEIGNYWKELAAIAATLPMRPLEHVAEILLDCYRRNGTVFVLGNGGSAATASHFVCDLAKGTRVPGTAPFRVVALTDNVPLMTAWSNDTSYERVFAEQLIMLARRGDVAVMISASGNSPNVLAAAAAARHCGVVTVALTGRPGGGLARMAEFVVRAPGQCMEQVEDVHLAMAHSLCVAIRARLQEQAGLYDAKNGDVEEEEDQEPRVMRLGRH